MLNQVTEILQNSPDLIEEYVLGWIPARDIPFISVVTTLNREGISNNIQIGLTVTVLSKEIPAGRPWKKGDTQFGQRRTIPGTRFGPQMNLGQTDEDHQETILSAFTDLARSLAPHLFELDPRIGLPIDSSWFPMTPLFDPMVFHHPPFGNGWSVWYLAHQEASLSNTPQRIPDGVSHCVFCGLSVLKDADPGGVVWGGGNIGWVHHSCTPWIQRTAKRG